MFKKIDLEGQIKVLFGLIACGFLLICLTALLALNGLKYDYDTNFSNRTYKVNFLEKVKRFYADITSFSTFDEFMTNYEVMKLDWDSYQNFKERKSIVLTLKQIYQKLFLKQEVQEIKAIDSKISQNIANANSSINQTLQIAKNLRDNFQWSDKNKANFLSTHSIMVDKQINEIFHLQNQGAFIQDKIADSIYSMTLHFLVAFMAFVIFITLYLAWAILRFMRDVNLDLQRTIQEQTRQLQESNKNLQRTIDKEIEQSRKKDRIMYQQARLASIGEMIQNIAHQWRQPLNSLIILIQSFKIKYDNNKLDKEFIDVQTSDALRIAKNMSDTIESFRNFFCPNIRKTKFSIAKSIQDSIALVYPTLQQNNIQIFFHKSDDSKILGYENAFSQVMLNLIKNAKDALIESKIPESVESKTNPESKKDFAESKVESSEAIIEIWLERCESEISLKVMDNAGGIKLKDLSKIFEPYFTTKHKSDGTGIGLYMAKQIVEKQMNGKIKAKNKQWESLTLYKAFYGAVFVIKFKNDQKENQDRVE